MKMKPNAELYQTGVISKDATFDIFKRVTAGGYELFLDVVPIDHNALILERMNTSITIKRCDHENHCL
jgi:hypothetical protein